MLYIIKINDVVSYKVNGNFLHKKSPPNKNQAGFFFKWKNCLS